MYRLSGLNRPDPRVKVVITYSPGKLCAPCSAGSKCGEISSNTYELDMATPFLFELLIPPGYGLAYSGGIVFLMEVNPRPYVDSLKIRQVLAAPGDIR